MKRNFKITLTLILTLAMLACLTGCGAVFTSASANNSGGSGSGGAGGNSASGTYTPPALDESLTYFADIDIEGYGVITVQLDQATAPVTCANFVELAESGFYDGLTFHRIMAGFMMQGGDPEGNGYGGSENEIIGEFKSNGHENNLSHVRGVISMARAAAPNSASSQFFICHADSEFLDGDYAAFGFVTEGMEVVDAVCEAAQPTDRNGTIPPEAQPVMNSVKIRTE